MYKDSTTIIPYDDIDELSEVLRSNTSFIYQRAVEKLLKEGATQ